MNSDRSSLVNSSLSLSVRRTDRGRMKFSARNHRQLDPSRRQLTSKRLSAIQLDETASKNVENNIIQDLKRTIKPLIETNLLFKSYKDSERSNVNRLACFSTVNLSKKLKSQEDDYYTKNESVNSTVTRRREDSWSSRRPRLGRRSLAASLCSLNSNIAFKLQSKFQAPEADSINKTNNEPEVIQSSRSSKLVYEKSNSSNRQESSVRDNDETDYDDDESTKAINTVQRRSINNTTNIEPSKRLKKNKNNSISSINLSSVASSMGQRSSKTRKSSTRGQHLANSVSMYDYDTFQLEIESGLKPPPPPLSSNMKNSISFPINMSSRLAQLADQEATKHSDDTKSVSGINSLIISNETENRGGGSSRDAFKQKLDQINQRWSSASKNEVGEFPTPQNTIYNSLSLNPSRSTSSSSLLTRPIIGKALVVHEFTPSPYDKNSLPLRVGDIVDVIDINETGIWTGILNRKFGTFKFIYVQLIESIKSPQLSKASLRLLINKSKSWPSLQTQLDSDRLIVNHRFRSLPVKLDSRSSPTSRPRINKTFSGPLNSISDYLHLISSSSSHDLTAHRILVDRLRLRGVTTCQKLCQLSAEYFKTELNIQDKQLVECLLRVQHHIKSSIYTNSSSLSTSPVGNSHKYFSTSSTTISQTGCETSQIASTNNCLSSSSSSSITTAKRIDESQKVVRLRNKMGQKGAKLIVSDQNGHVTTSNGLLQIKSSASTLHANLKNSSAASTTSSSNDSSKSKSINHYSAISNDSGCYTDRYSSPSGSSLLYLYDLASDVSSKQAPLRKSTPNNQSTLTNNKKKYNKGNNNDSSLCDDSIILSCSSSASSSASSESFLDQSNSDLDTNRRAQMLCDQLDKILKISTILVNGEEETSPVSSTNNKVKTLNARSNESVKLKSNRNQTITRSFTFSTNNNLRVKKFMNKSNENLADYIIDDKKEMTGAVKSVKNNRKLSVIFRNGRRLLSTLNTNKRSSTNHRSLAPSSIDNKEEEVTNLIAAKLMSENIDLARWPYSDEFGFCKIPVALIKRYSHELDQSVELVARCIESERLNQLEKQGKLGIPNDFLYTPCRCKPSERDNDEEEKNSKTNWLPCKCDIDTTSPELFLVKLGMPAMYIDYSRRFEQNSLHQLFAMSSDQVKQKLELPNDKHLDVILAAIQIAKKHIV